MSQSRARAWALFGVVLLMSACGGAGGGSASPSPPAPPPPASPPPEAPEEFLVAGSSQADVLKTVVVADPAQPHPPLLVADADNVLEVSNISFDADLRRVTYGYGTMVYYVRNGLLHQASLRKSQSLRTQRISSLTTACSIDDWHPFSYNTGDDGWVEVTEAGPDRSCPTVADNRKAFVRNSSPLTTDATMLPTGVNLLMALPDPVNNTLVGFVVHDGRATPSKLSMYDPTLTYVTDVAGSTGASSIEFMSFLPGAQLTSGAFVKIGTRLLRLTWSSTSATLAATGQSFIGANGDRASYFSDSTAMYFADGLVIKRMDASGTASTLATLSTSDGTAARLMGLTSDHLVVQQEATGGNTQTFTISKQGGTPLRLAPANWVASVVGLNGDEVIYATKPHYAITPAFRRIRADGSNERQMTAFGFLPYASQLLPVFSPTVPYSSARVLDAMMWCEVPVSESSCPPNGVIKSYDIRSGTITTLGNLSQSRGGLVLQGSGFSGRPTVINTVAGFTTDFHMLQPGTANSLVRLTTNIP